MDIILKQDIPSLGDKDDIITVKDGYARNYLIPKGLAVIATKSAKKMHAENLKQRAHKEEKLKNEAIEISEKLKELAITIGAKTSSTGKIFGSVNTIQLAEALNKQGVNIERKNISIADDAIKQIGKYQAKIKLHKEVITEIEFEVISE
ncbi:50S ribosomal protein L9 [Bacteroidota bacterium]